MHDPRLNKELNNQANPPELNMIGPLAATSSAAREASRSLVSRILGRARFAGVSKVGMAAISARIRWLDALVSHLSPSSLTSGATEMAQQKWGSLVDFAWQVPPALRRLMGKHVATPEAETGPAWPKTVSWPRHAASQSRTGLPMHGAGDRSDGTITQIDPLLASAVNTAYPAPQSELWQHASSPSSPTALHVPQPAVQRALATEQFAAQLQSSVMMPTRYGRTMPSQVDGIQGSSDQEAPTMSHSTGILPSGSGLNLHMPPVNRQQEGERFSGSSLIDRLIGRLRGGRKPQAAPQGSREHSGYLKSNRMASAQSPQVVTADPAVPSVITVLPATPSGAEKSAEAWPGDAHLPQPLPGKVGAPATIGRSVESSPPGLTVGTGPSEPSKAHRQPGLLERLEHTAQSLAGALGKRAGDLAERVLPHHVRDIQGEAVRTDSSQPSVAGSGHQIPRFKPPTANFGGERGLPASERTTVVQRRPLASAPPVELPDEELGRNMQDRLTRLMSTAGREMPASGGRDISSRVAGNDPSRLTSQIGNRPGRDDPAGLEGIAPEDIESDQSPRDLLGLDFPPVHGPTLQSMAADEQEESQQFEGALNSPRVSEMGSEVDEQGREAGDRALAGSQGWVPPQLNLLKSPRGVSPLSSGSIQSGTAGAAGGLTNGADSGMPPSSGSALSGVGAPTHGGAGGPLDGATQTGDGETPDLDALAREVYLILKHRFAVERERDLTRS